MDVPVSLCVLVVEFVILDAIFVPLVHHGGSANTLDHTVEQA